MELLKTGKDIKTDGDMSNLIIGIILRKTESFTICDILSEIRQKSEGSKVYFGPAELHWIVCRDIKVLLNNGRLCEKGKFTYEPTLIDFQKADEGECDD